MTGAPGGDVVIRRGARMASRAKCELIGVHVHTQDGLRSPPPTHLAAHRQLLQDLGGSNREVVGDDVARALVQVARSDNVTQLVLGSSRRSRITELLRGSVINAVIRASGAIDVHVITQHQRG